MPVDRTDIFRMGLALAFVLNDEMTVFNRDGVKSGSILGDLIKIVDSTLMDVFLQADWLITAILAYVKERSLQTLPVEVYKIGQDFGCSDLTESALRVAASVDRHVITLLRDCSNPSEEDQLFLMQELITSRSLKQVQHASRSRLLPRGHA